MKLPRVHQPDRYPGLYVFDFGEYANVGYTASEIAMLLAHADYCDGQAYEICRVDEDGSLYLQGATTFASQAEEAMAFLRSDSEKAQLDYQSIVSKAESEPLPCRAELVLTRVYDYQLSHVTAIIYKAVDAVMVSRWLVRTGFGGGDEVVCGADVRAQVMSAQHIRIASRTLPVISSYLDRGIAGLIECIDQPLQR